MSFGATQIQLCISESNWIVPVIQSAAAPPLLGCRRLAAPCPPLRSSACPCGRTAATHSCSSPAPPHWHGRARTRRCSSAVPARAPAIVDALGRIEASPAALAAPPCCLDHGKACRVDPSPPLRRRRAARPMSSADAESAVPHLAAPGCCRGRRDPVHHRRSALTPQAPAKLATVAMNAHRCTR